MRRGALRTPHSKRHSSSAQYSKSRGKAWVNVSNPLTMVSIPEKVFQRSYSKEDVFQRDNSPDLAKKRIPKKAVFQKSRNASAGLRTKSSKTSLQAKCVIPSDSPSDITHLLDVFGAQPELQATIRASMNGKVK